MRAQVFTAVIALTSVIPGRGAAANPEPTGRGAPCSLPSSHPVVGSGFSLCEPRNDKGGAQ
ncbi:hypothetical protein J2Y55_004257 [Bosea sp. BE125]|nr:hypothetical protein [Bosea sp. BE125]